MYMAHEVMLRCVRLYYAPYQTAHAATWLCDPLEFGIERLRAAVRH